MDENSFLFTALSISIPIIAMIVVFRAVTHGSAWIRVRLKDIRRGDHVVLSANILTQILKGITQLILIAVVIIPLLIVIGPFLFQTFPELKQLVNEVLVALFDKFSTIGVWFIGFLPHLIFWLIVILKFRIKNGRSVSCAEPPLGRKLGCEHTKYYPRAT